MHPLRTVLTLAAVAAPLAFAASPAHAADTYGSDLNATHGEANLSCDSYPCVLTQDTFGNGFPIDFPRTGVITRWRVKLGAGTQARLRLLESDFGSNYQPAAEGPSVTGTGGISTVDARVPLNGGRYFPGIQLTSGTLTVDTPGNDGTNLLEFDGAWNSGDWRPADLSGPYEALSQVVVEPDIDGDGYGDESQDSCVFCSGGGSGEVLPPDAGGSGGGNASTGSGGNSSYASSDSRPPFKLVIDNRGFYEVRNGKPQITVYLDNQGSRDLAGTVALKFGKTTLKPRSTGKSGRVTLESGDQDATSNFVLPKALIKSIKRRGSVALTATATFARGGKVTQPIKVRYGGLTSRYDGAYKGSGGIRFVVSGGFLMSITQPLNTFCPGSNRFQFASLFVLDGYPLMINRDGSFAAKGSRNADTIRYEGKIKPKGAFKGYSSIFHNQIRPNTDRIAFEQCYAASNWTAQRVN